MMDRRAIGSALALDLLSAPVNGRAQRPQRLVVVGTHTASARGRALRLLITGLREAGCEEGRHYRFESRFCEGNPAAFAAQNRLPAISPFSVFAYAGGLMSYDHNEDDLQPRAGGFVARILKGEKPGDTAVELPTKFELVINLKSAKAMGLTVPPALLLRADEVIE
jgi:ABC transporter substrate binding protein